MSLFTFRKIKSSPTVGEMVRKARQKKGLSLDQVSQKIRISLKYLQALESDDWEKLPGDIYINNFLKKYCAYLEIDFNKSSLQTSLKKLRRQYYQDSTENFLSRSVLKKSQLISYPYLIRNLVIVFIILAVFFYLGYKVYELLSPPKVTLLFPAQDLIVNVHTIEVKGQVLEEAGVILNGEDLGVDQNGFFSKTLDLKTGLNIINLQAKKRYGKETVIERKIIVQEDENIKILEH